MRCIAIDPGASTGWAVYEENVLLACGACKPHEVRAAVGGHYGISVDRVYVERPQKYPNDDVDPDTLITLAISAGIAVGPFAAAGSTIVQVRPREWKGQLPKGICHARSWAILSPAEQGVVARCGRGLRAKALTDMLDAVALGQHAIAKGLWR